MVLREEYRAIPRIGNRCEFLPKKKLTVDDSGADKSDKGMSLDSGLVELLQKEHQGRHSL